MNYEQFLTRIKDMFHFRTDEELQNAVGVGNGYCWKLRNGKIAFPDAIIKWLKDKNMDVHYFLDGYTKFNDGVRSPVIQTHTIPLLRQSVSCGNGQMWNGEDNIECYLEPINILRSMQGRPIYAFRARGFSMIGLGIQDGDILFFDGSHDQPTVDDVYVFALDGEAYCKLLRFERLANKVYIYSVHNRDLRDAELIRTINVNSDDFHIFGRVVGWMHENKLVER